MAAPIEIRPLAPDHDRAAFQCGEPALDRFFQHYAGQNQFKLGLTVTYVAVRRARTLGFATVAVGSIERRQVPDAAQPRRLPNSPLPILRLARLGVDQQAQGAGIGRHLLHHVFTVALRQRATAGCLGVVTDAKPGAAAFYEKLGFLPLEGVREGRLHGDPQPMFLDLRSVAAAVEG